MAEFFEILKAILFGIIEGVTEWLPISSTGHMILVEDLISIDLSPEFFDMFLVVIQLGAILAVPILFFDKLFPFGKNKTDEEKSRIWHLWFKVIVGVIPVGILGLLFNDAVEALFYDEGSRRIVVSVTLVVYGIAFIIVEYIRSRRTTPDRALSVYDLSYKDALCIGAFQILSLVPGTSRSGSTILGGMIFRISRATASEFSFYMAIPIMFGASFLKILKFVINGAIAAPFEILLLFIGMLVSFIVSVVAIKFLMSFAKKHSFTVFGVYRIVLGAIVLISLFTV